MIRKADQPNAVSLSKKHIPQTNSRAVVMLVGRVSQNLDIIKQFQYEAFLFFEGLYHGAATFP